MVAAINGHFEIVKCLIERGSDLHINSEEALKCAAQFGNLEMVKYLIKQGADFTNNDEEALRWAIRNKHQKIAEYLMSFSPKIKQYDSQFKIKWDRNDPQKNNTINVDMKDVLKWAKTSPK